ncbi:hypothetical protein NDU88_005789 [Pleurodeles waltl]|uniref:Uncharacterized protein n=1 Tax=Pleurodeles waltl TaxID=8319 RepID=A0AAV7WZN7_PLEWA|nr:hypothetical protein NDU88_005789 [Pleurodeles waltl]
MFTNMAHFFDQGSDPKSQSGRNSSDASSKSDSEDKYSSDKRKGKAESVPSGVDFISIWLYKMPYGLTLKHKWATLYIICNIIQQNDIEETFIILVFVTIEPLLNIMILEEFLKISPDQTNIVELIEEFSLQLPDFINYQSEECPILGKQTEALMHSGTSVITMEDIMS